MKLPNALLLLCCAACGGGSVDVSQSNNNDQRPGNNIPDTPSCESERRLESIDGILVCTESLICDGVVVRGPEIISVPLRQCNNIASNPNFVPTPLFVGETQNSEQGGGIQGSLTPGEK